MKKTLVTLLALVFVLSIGTAAFAAPANPFVDVPAKHWAYDAVSKLAKAGIVDGYGDGTFRGDKTMSRYEMAQIVAKAMAKSDKADAENKALIDKLAVEFASELNNLGVRVAKLEANASSVKMTGDLRARYTHASSKKDNTTLRLGLNLAATVNDNVSFTGRIIAQNKLTDVTTSAAAAQYNGNFNIEQAYVTVKDLGGMKLDLGRQPIYLGQGALFDADYFDGAKVSFGNALKVSFGYGDVGLEGDGLLNLIDNGNDNIGNIYPSKTVKFLNLGYNITPDFNVTAAALYSGSKIYANTEHKGSELQAFGFNYKLNREFKLAAEYVRDANADDNKSGYYAQLDYKGADKTVPGSYGLYATYVNMKKNTIDGGLTTLNWNADQKGWGYGFNYALAKNIIWSADVTNPTTVSNNEKGDTWWRTTVKFWF